MDTWCTTDDSLALLGIVTADEEKSCTEDEVEDVDEHSGADVATDEVLQMKDEEMSEEEVEEMMEHEKPVPCTLCGQVPCDWDTFGEEIWEDCEELKGQGADNKQVRFHAYKLYTCLRHGVLRRFDWRPLPMCIRGEIMDSWPDPNHVYVGYQVALHDVMDED
jgi:hypothetical protein